MNRFIYFNNLFFTISKEVLYKDLFKSILPRVHEDLSVFLPLSAKVPQVFGWPSVLSVQVPLECPCNTRQVKCHLSAQVPFECPSSA